MFRLRLLACLSIGSLLVCGVISGCPAGDVGGVSNGNGNANANAEANGNDNLSETDDGDASGNDNLDDAGDDNTNANDNAAENGNDNNTSNGNDNGDGNGDATTGAIIADHVASAHFEAIPNAYLAQAKSNLRVFYGHTSHGSQLVTGMNMVDTGPGELSLQENGGVDLGAPGDLGWVEVTRAVLDEAGNGINVVMWSWCGGVTDGTAGGIDTYLDAMDGLEHDHPAVAFVYMTGHLDGSGADGNLHARNAQIRVYCRDHDKILYDFADIESYDPAGNYYPNGSDACEWCVDWCTSHTCPSCAECAHTECFNCYQKGRAFWWLMARIAGWGG